MSRTRRDVLGMSAVASLAALAGCGGSRTAQVSTDTEYPALGNYPVGPDEVIFGMTVPKSGTYVSEGEAQLRGHELAVSHLNSGGGGVGLWDELSGDGVLGRTVTTVEGDTATDPTHARNEAARLINEGAIMLSGGSSSRVAVAVQRLCQQENVPFMAGIAHENRVTGADCARYGFREMPNTAMTSRALAVSLETELGSGRTMYQLHADYSWGREQSESIDRTLTSRAGWTSHDTVAVPTGREDYTDALARIPTDEVDVLVLTLYGLDAATILPQVRALDLHEEVELVVPLFNRLLARVASDAIGGVYGTVEWNWQLRNDFTIAFVDAFRRRYGRVPSYAAHLAYVQTLQFAAAAERAATFYPPEIIRELEGHTYDTGGLGSEQVLRECDHQAARSVLTVRGLPPDAQTRDRAFALIETTAWDQISYDCSAAPAVNCSLGDVR